MGSSSKVSSHKSSQESNDPPKKSNRIDSSSRRQDLISRSHTKEDKRRAEHKEFHQRYSKEREGTGRRRETKQAERSGNKKSSNQRSRSRSPRREKNLAPKEMQNQRARLIESKNFAEEARRLMEAPLASISLNIPVVESPLESQCPVFGKPLLDHSPNSEEKLPFDDIPASERDLASGK